MGCVLVALCKPPVSIRLQGCPQLTFIQPLLTFFQEIMENDHQSQYQEFVRVWCTGISVEKLQGRGKTLGKARKVAACHYFNLPNFYHV